MTRRRQVLVFVLIYALCLLTNIYAQQQQQLQQKQKEHFKRFNVDASGIVESVNSHYNNIYNNNNNKGIIERVNMLQQPIQLQQQQQQQQKHQQQQQSDTWNPLSTHKNWFILRATTTASNNAKHQQHQHHQQSRREEQVQQQQERLPVNYYAYNHRFNQSSGNYKQVVTQAASANNIDVDNNHNNNNKLFEDEVIDEQRVHSAEVSQPYVLAISKTMPRGSMLSRQNHHASAKPMPMPVTLPRVDGNILPKDITRRNIDETFLSTHSVDADIISQQQRHQMRQKQQQQQQQEEAHKYPSSRREWQSVAQVPSPFVENNDISVATSADGTTAAKTTENNVVNDNENVVSATIADNENNVAAAAITAADDNDDVDDVRLNELLLPLDTALDKVRFFCDIVKNIISDENDSDNENAIDDGSFDDEYEATGDRDDDLTKTAAASKETQGRDFALTTTSASLLSSASAPLLPTASLAATRALLSKSSTTTPLSTSYAGTGRKVKKLKKKFKKLLLPLLIAYKLKFLTLIPVLIGGLTLLVGTTGLAGFFFALFTAVMSLKSTGGSKSIIVKKV